MMLLSVLVSSLEKLRGNEQVRTVGAERTKRMATKQQTTDRIERSFF